MVYGLGLEHLEEQSNHVLRRKGQMGKHQKCSSRIVTLIRNLGGYIKLTVESRSLEFRNRDRSLGIMR